VVRACIAAKLCTEADPITFVAPGVHRDGEGFRAVLNLPYGSKAATFRLDARRRPIPLSLVWSSLLVGAIPRMGKTFAARLP
jgi:hypothetical protein